MASDPTPTRMIRDDWTRHVPLAVILALCVQSAAIIWWASGITAEVQSMHAKLDDISNNGSAPLQVRVSRLEVEMANLREYDQRMQAELDAHEANDAQRFRRNQ